MVIILSNCYSLRTVSHTFSCVQELTTLDCVICVIVFWCVILRIFSSLIGTSTMLSNMVVWYVGSGENGCIYSFCQWRSVIEHLTPPQLLDQETDYVLTLPAINQDFAPTAARHHPFYLQGSKEVWFGSWFESSGFFPGWLDMLNWDPCPSL